MDHPQFEVGDKPPGYDAAQGPAYYVEPPPKGRGCLFYGCIAAIVAGVIGMVIVAGGAYMLWYYYSKLIDEYTADAPLQLPEVEASEERIKEVEERWAAFKEALDKGEEAEIVLDQDDVNILVSREPDMKGRVYFNLEDDKAKVEISIDLTETQLPRTKGRFFNAKGTVTANVGPSGRLDIRLFDIEVRGKPLPPEIANQIGAENLADEMVKNRQNRELRDKIERIEVKESKVYIKSRALKPSEKPADEAKKPGEGTPGSEDSKPSNTVPQPSEPKPESPPSEPAAEKAA